MERFSFSETRYINSLMDYHAKKKYSLRPQKSFKDPHNKLSIYEFLDTEGRLSFVRNETHEAYYLIKDTEGNESSLSFDFTTIQPRSLEFSNAWLVPFSYDQNNSFSEGDFSLNMKPNSLYNDLDFKYKTKVATKDLVSDIHCVHSRETPVHSAFSIGLNLQGVKENLRSKTQICSVDSRGTISCLSSTWQGDTLIAKSRSFGDFSAVIDTVAPILKTKSFSYDLSEAQNMSFTVEDNLSGISTYNAFVDGVWVLLEYDPKNKRLTHFFDGAITSGKHLLELVVVDSVKNEKRLVLEFLR